MSAAGVRVWLVTLRFPPHGVPAPEVTPFPGVTTLDGLLTAVAAGRIALPGWPVRAPDDTAPSAEPHAPLEVLLARTRPGIVLEGDDHLVQCVHEESDGGITARYLFDAVYAHAHPEALDAEHLDILHGTLAAKIMDEGDVILDHAGLAASLRWRPASARGVRFSRDGGRRKLP